MLSKPVPRPQCWPMCANQTLQTPQLWILCSSWHLKPKLCLPRAEPGPCFSWWCAGVPVRGRGGFLLDSPCLCKGFSRSLATTHCPPYPPAALRCEGCGSQPWQDGGPRAHSPSSLSQAGGLCQRCCLQEAQQQLQGRSQLHGMLAEPRGSFLLGQLSSNDFGHMPEALAAAASDPSPLRDLLAQFPIQEATGQEGTARNTKFTLRNIPRFGIFPGLLAGFENNLGVHLLI